ncbi:MAG: hypothetical protein ACAI34_09360, partial [Verrucomicrobium sp.]
MNNSLKCRPSFDSSVCPRLKLPQMVLWVGLASTLIATAFAEAPAKVDRVAALKALPIEAGKMVFVEH